MSNNITIAGNIGGDSELKYAPSGDPVLSFSVACTTGYNKQKGEKETTWFNCTWFGKRAEPMAAMLTKGTKVTVFGTISERRWVDNEGGKRSSWNVRVNEVTLQGGKQEAGQSSAGGDWKDDPFG